MRPTRRLFIQGAISLLVSPDLRREHAAPGPDGYYRLFHARRDAGLAFLIKPENLHL